MRKNRIQHVIIHIEENTDFLSLANRISEFHVNIIEQELNQSDLTIEQKITVIDKILANLKSWEVNGIIK